MPNNEVIDGNLTVGGRDVFSGDVVLNAGTSTSAAGAVTLNTRAGVITTETLTTASQAVYTLTITNSTVTTTDIVTASATNGTNTTGIPVVTQVTPGAGTLVIKVANATTTTTPFGGTLKIAFEVFKAI